MKDKQKYKISIQNAKHKIYFQAKYTYHNQQMPETINSEINVYLLLS